MTSERKEGSDRFIVGTSKPMPAVPEGLLDFEVIWSQGERLGTKIAQQRDRECELTTGIKRLTSELEPKIFALATKRFEQGEYETVNKRRGEHWSFWEDRSDGYHNIALWFHAKGNNVLGVDKLSIGTGGAGRVDVAMKDGEIIEAVYKILDQNDLPKRIEKGSATELEGWMYSTVFQGLYEAEQERYQMLTDFTFVIFPLGVRLEQGFWPRRSKNVLTLSNDQEGKERRYRETKNEWIFNPEFNIFAQKYEAHRQPYEASLAEQIRLAKGDKELEALVREITKPEQYHRYPIFSPQEFTQGLELLLDTIPLE
jgi:hypothetical protein